jgi:hypothetical protein
MDHSLTPEQKDAVIESALQTYPLARMPRPVSADVMSRIQAVPAPRPFRLAWKDLVLALVFSLCLAALWFSATNLPPLLVAQIRKESILFYQHLLINLHWWLPSLAFGLAALLSALTIPLLKRELTRLN